MVLSHIEPAINIVINTVAISVALGIRIIVGVSSCISTFAAIESERGWWDRERVVGQREGGGTERGWWDRKGGGTERGVCIALSR